MDKDLLQKSMNLCKPVYVDLGDLTPVPGRIESSPDITYNGLDTTDTICRLHLEEKAD
jgi:hypothetical protein